MLVDLKYLARFVDYIERIKWKKTHMSHARFMFINLHVMCYIEENFSQLHAIFIQFIDGCNSLSKYMSEKFFSKHLYIDIRPRDKSV